MRRFWGLLALGLVVACPTFGCGDRDAPEGDDTLGVDSAALSRVGPRHRRLPFAVSARFECSGVVCASGFTCRTFSSFGVLTDQCVSDTGIAPTCSCAAGTHCVQEPSGAVDCQADVVARPAPAASCEGMVCPAGMHCALITNYGVLSTTCNRD